jgi:hypothetical protein
MKKSYWRIEGTKPGEAKTVLTSSNHVYCCYTCYNAHNFYQLSLNDVDILTIEYKVLKSPYIDEDHTYF